MNIYYKNNLQFKYNIENVSVLDGFLYFFGFRKNPYRKFVKDVLQRDDADALRGDWKTVGNDFQSVLKKESENLKIDACK